MQEKYGKTIPLDRQLPKRSFIHQQDFKNQAKSTRRVH